MNLRNLSKDFLDDPSFTRRHIEEMLTKLEKTYKATRSKSLNVLLSYTDLNEAEIAFITANFREIIVWLEQEEKSDMRMWIGLMITLAEMRYQQFEAMFSSPEEPNVIRFEMISEKIKQEVENLFRARADPLITAANANLMKDVELLLRDARLKGWGKQKVRQELNLIFDRAEKKAQMRVVTEAMYAFNAYIVEKAIASGYEYMVWVTANDERVCEVCGKNHMKKFKIIDLPDIPAHPNCRCILIPIK